MDQNSYRNLIAETDGGFTSRLLRYLLRLTSVVYRMAMGLRNFCYDRGWLKSYRMPVPVISVGNITTGGTGKTPLVIWICELLSKRSVRCAILTRGYKTDNEKFSDEPAILARACPQAKVIVDADRVSAAAKAISEFDAGILVMDDGFQHRRLRRDLDIIAIDATCPFGYGRVLPAGLLRESKNAIKRAHAVVITRYDQATPDDIGKLEETIDRIAPGITIAKAIHQHPNACLPKDRILTLEELREKRIFAFCGVGNPNAFLNRLNEFGLDVLGSKVYNDHHNYNLQDVEDIYKEARELEADLILSTQKDWVKTTLLSQKNDDILFAYLALELEFIAGADKIEALVDRIIRSDGSDQAGQD